MVENNRIRITIEVEEYLTPGGRITAAGYARYARYPMHTETLSCATLISDRAVQCLAVCIFDTQNLKNHTKDTHLHWLTNILVANLVNVK